jgi:GTP-binding protein Era
MNKSGFVAIIGKPNTGKSTLFNLLSQTRLAIISSKPGTTASLVHAKVNVNDDSFLLTDTPGLTKGSFSDRIVNKFIVGGWDSSDIILYVVDRPFSEGDKMFVSLFNSEKKIIYLIINKIDEIKDDKYLDKIMYSYLEKYKFSGVVPISATNNTNIDQVLELISADFSQTNNEYLESVEIKPNFTDVVISSIWQYCLIFLNEEIPYGLKIIIEHLIEEPDKKLVLITLKCRSLSHKKIIVGTGGETIKKIRINSQNRIKKILGEKVTLELKVSIQ